MKGGGISMLQTDIGKELLSASMAAREARAGRYIWGGAVANGLTLLGLIGLIGNVPDPDAALHFLLIPITVFVVGIALGGGAGQAFAQQSEVDVDLATDTASMEAVQAVLTSEDVDAVHGAGRLIAGRAQWNYGANPTTLAAARHRLIEANTKLGEKTARLLKAKQRLGLFISFQTRGSLAALLIGTALIAWKVEHGERLQPLKPTPSQTEQTRSASKR